MKDIDLSGSVARRLASRINVLRTRRYIIQLFGGSPVALTEELPNHSIDPSLKVALYSVD